MSGRGEERGEGVTLPFSQVFCCWCFAVCYVGVEKRVIKCVDGLMDIEGGAKSKMKCEDPFGRTRPASGLE